MLLRRGVGPPSCLLVCDLPLHLSSIFGRDHIPVLGPRVVNYLAACIQTFKLPYGYNCVDGQASHMQVLVHVLG